MTIELSVEQKDLLRTYLQGPFIWDATDVFKKVLELEKLGLVEPADLSGRALYQLTDLGRELCGEEQPSSRSRCPYPGCRFDGSDEEVDEHRIVTHRDEAQAGSNLRS